MPFSNWWYLVAFQTFAIKSQGCPKLCLNLLPNILGDGPKFLMHRFINLGHQSQTCGKVWWWLAKQPPRLSSKKTIRKYPQQNRMVCIQPAMAGTGDHNKINNTGNKQWILPHMDHFHRYLDVRKYGHDKQCLFWSAPSFPQTLNMVHRSPPQTRATIPAILKLINQNFLNW